MQYYLYSCPTDMRRSFYTLSGMVTNLMGRNVQDGELQLFKDYQGVIQSDGYAVYDINENKKGVLPIGCWAHARRKSEEALKEDKARASYALEQIGLLYDVERRADNENMTDKGRSELRSRLACPIMVAFEKWILGEYSKVLPKGRIGNALRYTYNIYHKLTRYHLDGKLKIDNNLDGLLPHNFKPQGQNRPGNHQD